MKKFLEYNKKNKKFVESLPTIYVVCKWAGYGTLTEHVACYKKDKETNRYIPCVYYLDDHNGEYIDYVLMPYYLVTTGQIICFVDDENRAKEIAEMYNNKLKLNRCLT